MIISHLLSYHKVLVFATASRVIIIRIQYLTVNLIFLICSCLSFLGGHFAATVLQSTLSEVSITKLVV